MKVAAEPPIGLQEAIGIAAKTSGPIFAVLGGSFLGAAFTDKLTTRGRVLHMLGGLLIGAFLGPALQELWWPHASPALIRLVYFATAAGGMTGLPFFFRAVAKWMGDPLNLIKPKLPTETST